MHLVTHNPLQDHSVLGSWLYYERGLARRRLSYLEQTNDVPMFPQLRGRHVIRIIIPIIDSPQVDGFNISSHRKVLLASSNLFALCPAQSEDLAMIIRLHRCVLCSIFRDEIWIPTNIDVEIASHWNYP